VGLSLVVRPLRLLVTEMLRAWSAIELTKTDHTSSSSSSSRDKTVQLIIIIIFEALAQVVDGSYSHMPDDKHDRKGRKAIDPH
jgi:hypothetical protein